MTTSESQSLSAPVAPSPDITVLTTACRIPYLRWQAEALKRQTFKDFEWVVVDDLYEQRKDSLKEQVNEMFPLVHIPTSRKRDYYAQSEALNDGLAHASG